MVSKISNGVNIKVKTFYNKNHSKLSSQLFHYEITIENKNNFEVKLIRRKWHIVDALNNTILVEGIGVIGEQPEFQAGEIYSYISGTEIKGFLGYMYGHYQFLNIRTGELFNVDIPKFKLEVPYSLN
jgi:ApaG protein